MSVQDGDAEMGKAYLDLAAAEQQATLLENQLRALESRIGAFLDEHDAPESSVPETSTPESEEPSKEQGSFTGNSSKETGA
ncbi:hypothetical protein FN846DRAFT_907377 [Sphaerosporella brunnea]|uniref:Uncharacterized protein n=1 Tax=Sphaerosporella brunnea TaxID=1250544 RepID=A0A5J5EWH8_9PEZI|nr:hypothetical protein FN846DRAFT_907377 [Sphaerosporella brunnea]